MRHWIAKDRGRLLEADFVLLEFNRGLSWIVIKLYAPLFHDAKNLTPEVRDRRSG